MSVITQQAWANSNTAFFLRADVSTLNVNSISTGKLTSGDIQANTIEAGTISTNILSTATAFIHDVEASTLYALTLQLDNQTLTATPTELLLNGIPLATTANLSSIADWSLDPAISTVQMDGNDLNAAGNVSSLNVRAGNGFFTNLIAFNSLFVSTLTSSISTSIESADTAFFSTLSSGSGYVGVLNTSSFGLGDNIYTAGGGPQYQINTNGQSSQAVIQRISTPLSTATAVQSFGEHGLNTFWEKNGILQGGINISDGGIIISDNQGGSPDLIVSTNNTYVLGDLSVAGDISGNMIQAIQMSTPALFVSSINGAEFTSTTITVQVAGVSSLVANSISSIGAELRTALVSTLQFNPSFSPSFQPNVNLGLGSILGNVIGWGAGVFGAAAGTIGMATGIASLAMGRQQDYIDNTKYELINGNTQLQFSTLGDYFSTIYRFNDSADPERIPGSTIYVSTISPPGLAIRSMSDPLNTVSTPNSTIQSFGQWVPVPVASGVASTISSFETLFTSSLGTSSITFSGIAPDLTLKQTAAYQIGALDPTNNLAQLTGVEFWSRGSLTDPNFGVYSRSGANRARYTDSNLTPHDLLYTVDGSASISSIQASTLTMGPGGTINILEDGSIQLGIAGGASGSLTAGVNPTLTLDGPNSEVSVPAVYTDKLGGKTFTTIDLTADINGLGNQKVYGLTELQANAVSTTAVNIPNGGFVAIGDGPTSEALLSSNTLQLYGAGIVSVASTFTDQLRGYSGNVIRTNDNFYIEAPGTLYANQASISTLTTSSISTVAAATAALTFTNICTINVSTSATAGTQNQPIGRLVIDGNDLDLRQNDLWVQQIRVGAGNVVNAPTEIIFYDSANSTKGFNSAQQDRAIRVVSTVNATTGGYLLDTSINPPFFSTIAGSTNMMAFFPSTTNSTIGVSTIAILPPVQYAGSWYSSTPQTVAGANTETPLSYNSQSVNVGGFTYAGSTITVPLGGLYEITHSIQFATTSGGTNEAYFWVKKNGATIPQSGSIVSVVNNGETLGTISLLDQAAAGDKYAVSIQSADANMSAQAFAASGNIPGIPSVITNIKRL